MSIIFKTSGVIHKATLFERIEHYTFYSPDGCWYWLGHLNEKGYGVIKVEGRVELAHRVNYQICKKPIPNNLFACHSCDNPSCINPNHIFISNCQGNMDDMHKKGRSNPPKGERNRHAIITATQALEIRKLKGIKTHKQIAEIYGLRPKYVYKVVNARVWKHL